MKKLVDCKDKIHSCSKCGLCQSVCPIYQITGNDCSVSRGHFIMLRGLIKGDLKMSKKINRYLDLCLKCGACSKFCPSGIDVVDIIVMAKQEYFKAHKFEKIVSFLQKHLIFNFGVKFLGLFSRNIKSKTFDKKVIYYGGCGGRIKGNSSVVNILNTCGIEVLTPNFDCCGIPFLMRGDIDTFKNCIDSFLKVAKKSGITEIVTTCASCEKTLKDYIKWSDDEFLKQITICNIYEYMRQNELKLKLKKKARATYHKPCNINNFSDIEWVLNNTENLEYIQMEDFDKCCGLNGVTKISEYKILSRIFFEKHQNILRTKVKDVLTSCLGCEVALNLFSFGKYRVLDLIEFLNKRI